MSGAVGRWLGWAEARLAPLAGDRRVVLARRVVDRYNGVRGGLLAAGLAYGALFSILTGLLFFVGVVGLFVDFGRSRRAAHRGSVAWRHTVRGD